MTVTKRFIAGIVPYILVITALILISSGLVRYIEHESVLSLVILRKDATPVIDEFFKGDLYGAPHETTRPVVESTRKAAKSVY